MVAVPKERTFPRGGREEDQSGGPKRKGPDWCKTANKAFNKKTNSRNRNRPFGKRLNEDAVADEIQPRDGKGKGVVVRPYTGKLTYGGIAEGMLILGTVYRVSQYELGVSLPGNCIGKVPITNVSEHYTRSLACLVAKVSNEGTRHLRDMFRVGQHVVTKVVKKGDQNKVVLTLAPEAVHSDCSCEDILVDTVFTAAVVSVQEKGYVMDLGVKSSRAFLKKENSERFEKVWNRGNELGVGQLVLCLVTEVTSVDRLTTVVLTSDPDLVAKASNSKIGARLQGMLPGMLFHVTVTRPVFPSGMQVRLSDNVIGYVPPNHLAKAFKKPEDFGAGRVYPARIIYVAQSGAIFFSMKGGIFPSKPPVSPFKALKAGFTTDSATVWEVSKEGLTVRMGKTRDAALKGFIPTKHLHPKPTEETEAQWSVGSVVTCRVMDYCHADGLYVCTMDPELMKERFLHPSSLRPGQPVTCFVREVTPKGVVVSLGRHSPVTGFVPALHVSNAPLSRPDRLLSAGQTCPAKVLSLDNNVVITMKQSLLDSSSHLTSFDSATVGRRYPGTIVLINKAGILVEFYSGLTAFVPRSHLGSQSTRNTPDLAEIFFVGQVVNCTLLGKVKETRKLIVTLADMETSSQEGDEGVQDVTNASDVVKKKKKSKENGSVTSEPIKLDGDSDAGLREAGGSKRMKKKRSASQTDIHIPDGEITASKKPKLSRKSVESSENQDRVKNNRKLDKVASKSEVIPATSPKKTNKKGKLSTSAVQSEATTPDSPKKSRRSKSGTFEVSMVESSEEKEVGAIEENTSTKKKRKKKKKSKSYVSMAEIPDDDTDSSFEMKTSNSSKKSKKLTSVTESKKLKTEAATTSPDAESSGSSGEDEGPVELPSLSAATGFVWDATPSLLAAGEGGSGPEESSDDEVVEPKKGKRSRKAIVAEKRLQAQMEEARLRSIEQRLMDPGQLPQTADEFDRLVLSSPDNSMVWLQYMAHHIQATEIEKARSIAQRALKTISFREEQEKLNVWVAWLNLENLYGTTESMKNTFEEAIRLNDPYQVYTQTLQIYADSHKLQDGDELIAIMTRKFKAKKEMWTNVAALYMKSGQVAKSRALLQRALASLEPKEHVSVITQFALLENKLGSRERAQTLMEQILTSYPKRVDVWSVYVDMLVKSDLVHMARQVLERAVAQRLPSHKMKTLFKKFLAFEESHGTEEGAIKVRQLALDYVEAAAGTTME